MRQDMSSTKGCAARFRKLRKDAQCAVRLPHCAAAIKKREDEDAEHEISERSFSACHGDDMFMGVSVQAKELSEEQYETSDTAGESPGEEEESYGVMNGIPVLSLTIDPDEFQAVLDSPEHKYQAENCSVS